MKGHELRELVNALTATAVEFAETQQLRERIAGIVRPAIEALVADREERQAKIDALMLEYCPDEMTPEQRANWAAHQRPVDSAEEAAINAAIAEADHSSALTDEQIAELMAGPFPRTKCSTAYLAFARLVERASRGAS